MKCQHMAHTAVQENDLEMRTFAWESMLLFYFYFNKTNYGRYGTYYFLQFNHLKTLNPGLKQLLEAKGIGVQPQSSHHKWTFIN